MAIEKGMLIELDIRIMNQKFCLHYFLVFFYVVFIINNIIYKINFLTVELDYHIFIGIIIQSFHFLRSYKR